MTGAVTSPVECVQRRSRLNTKLQSIINSTALKSYILTLPCPNTSIISGFVHCLGLFSLTHSHAPHYAFTNFPTHWCYCNAREHPQNSYIRAHITLYMEPLSFRRPENFIPFHCNNRNKCKKIKEINSIEQWNITRESWLLTSVPINFDFGSN